MIGRSAGWPRACGNASPNAIASVVGRMASDVREAADARALQERAYVRRRWCSDQLSRRRDLLDSSAAKHGDVRRQQESLVQIMRDKHAGHREARSERGIGVLQL